jgi:hypothetical protein
MAETPPGLTELLNLLGAANPVAALTKNLDNLKRGVESLVGAVQSFSSTMESLQATSQRITALLDEIEEPIRHVAQQLAALPPDAIPNAVANLDRLAGAVGKLFGPSTNA